MPSVVILIPPSEGKVPSGDRKPLGSLNKDVQVIYDRLAAHRDDLSALYGVKDKALEAAKKTNAQLLTSPTLAAISRYSGVVYDGIDYPTLSAEAKKFFDDHVRIVSAMFGLIKPQDLIPDYKLKIEKLDAAKFWRPLIAQKLTESYVIDLLPQAHQKAVEYKKGIRIDFIVIKKGKSIPAGHFGKLIKGRFIRWICEHAVTKSEDLVVFRQDGFQFDGKNFIKVV